MQVLVLVRFLALIHRNRVLLTTTIKHVYLLVLVNKEQRHKPEGQAGDAVSIFLSMAGSIVQTTLLASMSCTSLPMPAIPAPDTLAARVLQAAGNG